VTNSTRPFEATNDFLIKDVGDMAHAAMDEQRLAVRGGNAGGFLPAMLQRVQRKVGKVGSFRMTVDADHAALLVKAIESFVVSVFVWHGASCFSAFGV
jgi:hypothetical protein